MNIVTKLCFAIVVALSSCLSAFAFDASSTPWADGKITFKVNFAESDANLIHDGDGSGSVDANDVAVFQSAFEEALDIWTNSSTFEFEIDNSEAADPCLARAVEPGNGVKFDDDDCGDGYGASTLAVQTAAFSGGSRVRTTITFNNAFTWRVYNGPFQFGLTDFRRVAVHELGHSLGLGHEVGAPAIMQPSVSSTIEIPQTDDLNGVAAMYDQDNDGIGFAADNCPITANADQSNIDMDNFGDVCDSDIDGDLVFNDVTVDQSFAADSSTGSYQVLDSSGLFAQTFTVGITGTLSAVALPIFCTAGNLKVSIQTLNGENPSGVELDSVTDPNGFTRTPAGFVQIDLNDIVVTANQQLAIVIDTNDRCLWETNSGSYSGGERRISNNNGGFWFSSGDFPFSTFVLGVADNCPTVPNPLQEDADMDLTGDACELAGDPDDDDIPNEDDNCPTIANPNQENFDGDLLGDACDSDDDGDNIDDGVDNCLLLANNDQANFDGDLLGDACDSDDDGDNIDDGVDNCLLLANNDQANFDGDLLGDACDSDDDGDNIDDGIDNCLLLANNDQANFDGDLLGDACDSDDDGDNIDDGVDNCLLLANNDQANFDGDLLGDACDSDDDGDNIDDGVDNCLLLANNDQANFDGDLLGDACDSDDDGDSIDDGIDNCLLLANSDQANFDGDLLGDACDSDDDGDNVDDSTDNCLLLFNEDQIDLDQDQAGDLCDLDDDGDNLNDDIDNCPRIDNNDQLNTDGDLDGNACDEDDDNDGVIDVMDTAELDPFICEDADGDSCDDCSIGNDGFGNLADNDTANDGVDTNGNGQCDLNDPDDDSDGVNDLDEFGLTLDNCRLIPNPLQEDGNNNGIGDLCDQTMQDDALCIPIKTSSGNVAVICL